MSFFLIKLVLLLLFELIYLFDVQEIYGRLPIPSPSVTHDGWLKGAIEKPKTKEVTTETPLKKGLSSGRRQSEENQMKFMKPADMKAFIMQSRSSCEYSSIIL